MSDKPIKKRSAKDIQGSYEVTGGPVHQRFKEGVPEHYEFRCASVNSREGDHRTPPSLLITVDARGRKEIYDGPSAHDLVEIWSPSYTIYEGLIYVRGFAIDYILDGKEITNQVSDKDGERYGSEPGDNYAAERGAGCVMTEICMRAESSLKDDGTWK
jgi:hypothetical protein